MKPIIVSQILEKAPINSPTFTGTPQAPTPALNDNSTKLATTAFVGAHINSNNTYIASITDTYNTLATLNDRPIILKNEQASYNLTLEPSSNDSKFLFNQTSLNNEGINFAQYTLKDSNTWTKKTNSIFLEPSNINLSASGWSGSEAPYSYTISNAAVTASSYQTVIPSPFITAEELSALQSANIIGGPQTNGALTLYAFGEKPEINIPIQLIFLYI